MKLSWKVDKRARRICWGDLDETPLRFLGHSNLRRALDLGSGSGAFGRIVTKGRTELSIIDIDRKSLMLAASLKDVNPVEGNILFLPFKDSSFDLVTARAILHHVPDSLPQAIGEIKRVLETGGILIAQEPLAENPIANLVRRIARTELHDPNERPLSYSELLQAITQSLKKKKVRFHFLFSYLLPHVLSRLDGGPLSLWAASFLSRLDVSLLKNLPKLRKRAAYLTIMAQRLPKP